MSIKARLHNFKGQQVKELQLPHAAGVVRWEDRFYGYKWSDLDGTQNFTEKGFFWAEAVDFQPYWLFKLGNPVDGMPKGGMADFAGVFKTFDDAEAAGEQSGESYQIIDERNPNRFYKRSRVNGAKGWSDGRS